MLMWNPIKEYLHQPHGICTYPIQEKISPFL